MLKVTGSITVEFESDGEKIDQKIEGAEFGGVEEDGWRNLGDSDRQYEALFIYSGDKFQVIFQATYFQGQITSYPCKVDGSAKILDDSIEAVCAGSGDPEDDYDNYQ